MEDYSKVVAGARAAYLTGRTRGLTHRKTQLRALRRCVEENEDAICAALAKDLRKPRQECILMELNGLKDEVSHLLNNLDELASPRVQPRNLVTLFDTPIIQPEPYGVALVMGSWNYPFILTLQPVAGAIAAGNAVIVKPSEVSAACSRLMAELLPKYLDHDLYRVVEGGVPETTELLKQKFDYIFYTGSTTVGRIIHAAATAHLTPVTLELGGKSPVFLDDSVNLDLAVKRILWGKLINMGQTCVAPDYLLCSKKVQEAFISKANEVLEKFYGGDPQKSVDLGRIINRRHTERLAEYLSCGRAVIGGKVDLEDVYVAPTVLVDVDPESKIMKEEIFGPILPIINVESVDEAIAYINAREKPLTLYVYSSRRRTVDALLTKTSSGGACVNDSMVQLSVLDLPFGGVGASGMGAYHGKESFWTFSHRKSCLHRNYNPVPTLITRHRFAPYSGFATRFISAVMAERWLPSLPIVPAFCVAVGAAGMWLAQTYGMDQR